MIDSEIRTEHVRYTLALIEETLIDTIIERLLEKNTEAILTIIERLREQHVQSRSFFEQLLYRLRDLMIEHIGDNHFFAYESIFTEIESAYAKVRSIPDGMMLIEITLLIIAKGRNSEILEEKKKVESPISSPKVDPLKAETPKHTKPESQIETQEVKNEEVSLEKVETPKTESKPLEKAE